MVARLSAAALAVLATGCFATLLVLGTQVGWVVEVGGGDLVVAASTLASAARVAAGTMHPSSRSLWLRGSESSS